MRKLFDQNATRAIFKITNGRGTFTSYQVCDRTKKEGTSGYVVGNHPTSDNARKEAGIPYNPPSQQTLPKSAYPEQQNGYKKGFGKKK